MGLLKRTVDRIIMEQGYQLADANAAVEKAQDTLDNAVALRDTIESRLFDLLVEIAGPEDHPVTMPDAIPPGSNAWYATASLLDAREAQRLKRAETQENARKEAARLQELAEAEEREDAPVPLGIRPNIDEPVVQDGG